MASYYVNQNAQASGDHEVHKEDCFRLPDVANRTYLGDYSTCQEAVRKAGEYYTQANGCFYCANECHTT